MEEFMKNILRGNVNKEYSMTNLSSTESYLTLHRRHKNTIKLRFEGTSESGGLLFAKSENKDCNGLKSITFRNKDVVFRFVNPKDTNQTQKYTLNRKKNKNFIDFCHKINPKRFPKYVATGRSTGQRRRRIMERLSRCERELSH